MDELNYLFRILSLSQVLLFTAYLSLFERHRAGTLAALTGVAFSVYLMMPFIEPSRTNWTLILIIIATLIPSLIWLLSYWFFRDTTRIPPWLIALTAGYVVLSLLPLNLTSVLIENREFHDAIFSLLPQLVKLLLVLHVGYLALSDRDADLVDVRRRLRRPIAIGAAGLAALVIMVEIWAGDLVPSGLEAMGSVLMFLLAITANLFMFRSRLDLAISARPVITLRPENTSEGSRVVNALVDGRLYAEHGMTLTGLSTQLRMPVHKLRHVINKQLGYRNFNQFLNHYRISEASKRLLSEQVPILTIALDVGFKSLSSFNTAFKQRHGTTPSEYRARPPSDS